MFFATLRSDRQRLKLSPLSPKWPSWRQPKPEWTPAETQPKTPDSTIKAYTGIDAGHEVDERSSPPGCRDGPRRRKSLSNVFLTVKDNVKAKLRRSDRSSSSSHEEDATSFRVIDTYPEGLKKGGLDPASYTARACPPPQLEALPGFSNGTLTRSSTFRAGIEKAVDNINSSWEHSLATGRIPIPAISSTVDIETVRNVSRPTILNTRHMEIVEEQTSESSEGVSGSNPVAESLRIRDVPPVYEQHDPRRWNGDPFSSRIPTNFIDHILEITQGLRTPPEDVPPVIEPVSSEKSCHYRSKAAKMCRERGISFDDEKEKLGFGAVVHEDNSADAPNDGFSPAVANSEAIEDLLHPTTLSRHIRNPLTRVGNKRWRNSPSKGDELDTPEAYKGFVLSTESLTTIGF